MGPEIPPLLAKHGHLSQLQWADGSNVEKSDDACEEAARYGHLDCLVYLFVLLSSILTFLPSALLMLFFIMHILSQSSIYLHRNGYGHNAREMRAAARSNNLDVIKYAADHFEFDFGDGQIFSELVSGKFRIVVCFCLVCWIVLYRCHLSLWFVAGSTRTGNKWEDKRRVIWPPCSYTRSFLFPCSRCTAACPRYVFLLVMMNINESHVERPRLIIFHT